MLNKVIAWGVPAKVVVNIDLDYTDDDSIAIFGEKTLEITDNNYWGNYEMADEYATYVLENYANYNNTIEVECRMSSSLQLGDLVAVNSYDATGTYRVEGINIKWGVGDRTNVLTLTEVIT